MRYIHETLLQDEQIAYLTKPHWIIFSPSVLTVLLALFILGMGSSILMSGLVLFGFSISSLIGLACLAFGGFSFIKAYIDYKTSEYGITTKRVLMKTGWIERNSLELFLDRIEAVNIDQTILGRVLSYGTIIIIGTGGTKDLFTNVPDPLKFRKLVQQQIDIAEHGSHSG